MALLARAGKLAAIPSVNGMKTHSNTAPRNAQASNHPPLARDGYGNAQAVPDGAAGWCLKRETGGRPKMIVGADRQPARFPLDVTADDIEGMVGAGTYRVYAIGAEGEVLDYVTTVSVGESASTEPEPAPASLVTSRGAGSDLRFALETILQMSRAQSDSLKAVVLAQADWVKGLATAKAMPRNGYPVAAPPAPYRMMDEPEDEEDDEDEEDEEDDEDESGDEPDAPQKSPWTDVVSAIAPVLQMYGERFMQKPAPPEAAAPPPAAVVPEAPHNAAVPEAPRNAAVPEAPRNAAPEAPAEETATATPNPMIHLSEINARLTGFERKFLNVVLRGAQGSELANVLLTMGVDEAASFVKEQIARVQGERDASGQGGAAPPADSPPADAAPVDAPRGVGVAAQAKPSPAASGGSPDFMSRVLAASAYLTAEERAAVMWLMPRFPAARLEELKVKLLRMTPREAAIWIRENLAALRDEVSS